MAREIKFRAWSKVEEEMVYGIDLTTQDGTAHPINGNWDNIMSLDERVELMQYTGLKDKNGVEIYEGDIVQWYDSEPNIDWYGNVQGQVIWQDGAFFVPAKGDFSSWLHDLGELKVIGSIYENPELLKNNGEDTK